MKLFQGDCLEVLKTLDPDSIDSLVTDPPAGISFMSKEWDHHKGGRKEWCAWMESVMRECIRVMKPGAHGLVWALPRTSHWTATALEDAGFEIRDCIYHLFGSGFPKSLDVSKAIDKAAGAEREVVGPGRWNHVKGSNETQVDCLIRPGGKHTETAPATDDAKRWQGFGTALKPAVECWWLVRKPISEKTVAANVLKWGTGALNIDDTRIQTAENLNGGRYSPGEKVKTNPGGWRDTRSQKDFVQPQGRFPSHLVLSHSPHCTDTQCDIECAVSMLDAQSGERPVSGSAKLGKPHTGGHKQGFSTGPQTGRVSPNDSGGASRFFYCAKVSPSERGDSTHPTMKSQKLMRYLCKLITPPGGTILDPFMGSGSTGLAAKSEGFEFVGIEREAEYFEIANARLTQKRI